jgi:predicted DNA-binding transcriptional regulator AlpA
MKKQSEQDQDLRLIVYRELRKLVPLSRSALLRLEKSGEFPRRRLLTRGRVAWALHEVQEWLRSRSVVSEEIQPTTNLPQIQPQAEPEPQQPVVAPQPPRRHWTKRFDE